MNRLRQIRDEAQAILGGQRLELKDEAQLSWAQRLYYFGLLVARNFILNRCPVRATALAYTTLLALIPLLAVVMGIYTSVLKKEGDEPIRVAVDRLIYYVAPQLDLVDRTNTAGLSLLTSTNAPSPRSSGNDQWCGALPSMWTTSTARR